ncbi:hypothetical protein NKH18_45425 [Streptomyces sp. M10(2022)]
MWRPGPDPGRTGHRRTRRSHAAAARGRHTGGGGRRASVIYVGPTVTTGKGVLSRAVAHAREQDALVIAPLAPDTLPKDAETGELSRPAAHYYPADAPGCWR